MVHREDGLMHGLVFTPVGWFFLVKWDGCLTCKSGIWVINFDSESAPMSPPNSPPKLNSSRLHIELQTLTGSSTRMTKNQILARKSTGHHFLDVIPYILFC